jgi:hypothetical protein
MKTTETAPPPPRRTRGRALGDVAACRRALAAYVNMLEAEEIEPRIANSIFGGLSILIGTFRDEQLASIEAQLEELRRQGVLS